MRAHVAINGSFLVQPSTGVQRFASELIKALRELGIEDLVVLAPNGYPEENSMGTSSYGTAFPGIGTCGCGSRCAYRI